MYKATLMSILLISAINFVFADTLIKIKTEDGSISEIQSNGKSTRLSMAPEPGYVLINHSNNNMYIVMPEERTILNMKAEKSPAIPPAKLDVKIRELGKGPTIAGYATKKFNLTADGQDCGTIFGSQQALNNSDINKVFVAVNEIMASQNQMTGGMSPMKDACEQADMDLLGQTKMTGLPLKTLDANGALTSEVISINTREKFSDKNFDLPPDYTITTMAEMMQDMQQQMAEQMQEATKHMPDMEQMMNQMENMSPEMKEELEKMQERMK